MKKTQSYYIGFGALCFAVLMAVSLQLNAFNYFQSVFQGFKSFSLFGTPVTEEPALSDNAIQIALLLDTSNSMDGLIEQTKSQLWKIVNELSRADKDGETPNLQIALYEYGNDGLSSVNGFIRKVAPFTGDMDLVSEKLFSLTTNGGSEFCGHVIQTSLNELKWTNSDDGLRMIYIAGNEGFNQGRIPYSEAIRLANEKGVTVNTIFCGDKHSGMNLGWNNAASLGQGVFASIDQNQVTTYTATPYDRRIQQLNSQLNETFIPYGDKGKAAMENVRAQDSNASSYSRSNAVDRAVFKGSKMYKKEKWDYVEAYEKNKNIVKDKSKMPEKFKGKSEEEVVKEVKKEKARRDKIQAEISKLGKDRLKYINENKAKTDTVNLENSILNSIKEQAKKKGYKIKN